MSLKSRPRHRFRQMSAHPERASTRPDDDAVMLASIRPNPTESNFPILKVKRLSSNAKLPVRASSGAAGYDLFAAEDCCIDPHTRRVVKTDLSIAVPVSHYGRVAPRSGLSFKYGIDIAAGVIDSDYRGPVGIVMVNNGKTTFDIKTGDRVAQLLLECISTLHVQEVDELDDTERGMNRSPNLHRTLPQLHTRRQRHETSTILAHSFLHVPFV